MLQWDEAHSGKDFDLDDSDHMNWVYKEGVVKNIIPAIASTNAIISAACALETLKMVSGCSKTSSNYMSYNAVEGLHTEVTELPRVKDCLVCGPGVLVEVDTSITIQKFHKLNLNTSILYAQNVCPETALYAQNVCTMPTYRGYIRNEESICTECVSNALKSLFDELNKAYDEAIERDLKRMRQAKLFKFGILCVCFFWMFSVKFIVYRDS